jgi:hypothetical protein
MSAYAAFVGICILSLAIFYGDGWAHPTLEAATTVGAVFLALAATQLTVGLQQAESRNRWRMVLETELEQMVDVLERPSRREFQIRLPDRPRLSLTCPA